MIAALRFLLTILLAPWRLAAAVIAWVIVVNVILAIVR